MQTVTKCKKRKLETDEIATYIVMIKYQIDCYLIQHNKLFLLVTDPGSELFQPSITKRHLNFASEEHSYLVLFVTSDAVGLPAHAL